MNFKNNLINENLYLAIVAEQCERYDEMVDYLKEFSKNKETLLSKDERNLLSIGYSKIIKKQRRTLTKINELEEVESKNNNSEYLNIIKEFKNSVEIDLVDLCNEVISLMDELLKKDSESKNVHAKAFYNKMKGDYYRYMSETTVGKNNNNSVDKAEEAYEEAKKYVDKISEYDLISLGFYLNYTVFYYEVKGNNQKAIKIIKKTIDSIDEKNFNCIKIDEEYQDIRKTYQALKENYIRWIKETPSY